MFSSINTNAPTAVNPSRNGKSLIILSAEHGDILSVDV
jgi:hypothetical protein